VGRCRPDWRYPGGPGNDVNSRDWIVLPARGPVPRRPTHISHHAIWHCALIYAQEARREEQAARLAALAPDPPMDPFDDEALAGLTAG
jgi:hypothetical protein